MNITDINTTIVAESSTAATERSIAPYDHVEVEALRGFIRSIVRGAYDIQNLRMQMGNRVAAAFRTKLGVKSGTKVEDADKEAETILKRIAASYASVTEGYTQEALPEHKQRKQFEGDAVISTWTELVLVEEWISLQREEQKHFHKLEWVLRDHPLYPWLKSVKGVGPAMAGVIISEIDITRAQYPSSLWAYAGLDVARDGRGRSRRAEHLVEREYTDKNGKKAKRNGITYNPFLKTKLMGVLAGSFVKQKDSPYRDIYDGYKHRLETSPEFQAKQERLEAAAKEKKQKYAPVGHRNDMAKRYVVKMFLVDLYKEWRALAGLPVAPSYAEAKLGLVHGSAEKYAA